MKILIVGGGIGGLAAAAFLERKGFEVVLVERAPEFKNIGFTMGIFNNGRRLLRELGIDDDIAKEGYEVPWTEFINIKGKIIGPRVHTKLFLIPGSEPGLGIERAKLHESLISCVKNTKVILGTTLNELENHKDKVHVVFSDGTKHTFDLLVAADGIHSHIRETVFGHNQSEFYDWSLRFFWMPAHIPKPKGITFLSKSRTTLAFYPTLNKCSVALYEYNPKRVDHPPLPLEEFLPYLKKHGWTKEHIEDIYKEAKEGHQFYDHLRHVNSGRWYKRRVVLLGDSRHGLSPVAGLSGSMAMEDAFVLADELAKVDTLNIETALQNYSQRREKRVEKVIKLSNLMEKFSLIKNPIQKFIRDIILLCIPEDFVPSKFRKIIYTEI